MFYAWLFSHLWWLGGLIATLDDCNPCASLGTLQFLFAYVFLATCVPPVVFAWKAWQIHRAGQFPPPGAWVLFRRRIHTGWWARFNAFGMLVGAVFFSVAPVAIWRELDPVTIFLKHGC